MTEQEATGEKMTQIDILPIEMSDQEETVIMQDDGSSCLSVPASPVLHLKAKHLESLDDDKICKT